MADRSKRVMDLEQSATDTLSEKIRVLRARQRLNLRQAARRAHVSASTISRIERGFAPTLGAFLALTEWVKK